MFHRIKSVTALPELMLKVQFLDGSLKEYNVTRLIEKLPAFNALRADNSLFHQVRVDVGGYGIVWNDELDLSCDELWENGTKLNPDDMNLKKNIV